MARKAAKTKANKALKKKVTPMVKSVMARNAEHKFFDQNWSITNLPLYADQINSLTQNGGCVHLMAIGDTAVTRTGNLITGTALRIRFQIYDAAASPSSSIVRMMVIRSLGSDFGTAPLPADFLSSYGVSGPDSVLAHPNHNFTSKDGRRTYKILRDKVWTLADLGGTPYQRYMSVTVPLHGAKVQFVGSGASLTDLGAGAYYVYFWSNVNQAAGSSAAPGINWKTRFEFTDD